MTISRRIFLKAGAGAGILAGTGSRAQTIASPTPGKLKVLSPNPADLEMPVEGFVDEITPTASFFVRAHTYTPQVKLAEWKLTLDGLIDRPATLTLSDLKSMPRTELVAVLECAGNGRSFYEPHMAGAQWQFGSVGNARWAGVRLRDVLNKVGLKAGASQLLLDGADVPLGKMPDFQRTVAVSKALEPDTLLAWEMNGQPLTPEHGFPLRLIAPGWAGDSWVKWLQHIEVLDHEFEGFWMKTAYRHPAHSVAPGTAVDAKDMVPVTDLNIKSAIAVPGDWAKPGPIAVQGVAWSNGSPVTKVEVSDDSGQTWKSAMLMGKPTKYGFRKWHFAWRASEGQHTLISRASDASGRSQPLQQEWNPSGYLWNVAQARKVLISAQRPAPVAPAAESVSTPDPYKTACIACHDDHMMRQQRLTRAQWEREIDKMTGWGADVKPSDRSSIVDYLASQFRP